MVSSSRCRQEPTDSPDPTGEWRLFLELPPAVKAVTVSSVARPWALWVLAAGVLPWKGWVGGKRIED